MDRLQAMQVFVTVVDTGGFASAARKLDLSPPVVTRAVAELEARLGLRLLTRTTRFVRVTDAGARYAEDCRRILGDIEEAEAAATGTHSEPRGTLHVTAPVLFGRLYVTPVVTEYLRQWPQVDAQCVFVDRVINLVEEGVDVAIRIGRLPDSSLQAIQVGKVRRMLVAAPAYLAEHGIPVHPGQLHHHQLVASTAGMASPTEWRFKGDGPVALERIRPRLQISTNDAAIAAVVRGAGIARVLSYQVAPQLQDGSLQGVLEDFEETALPVQVVHFEGRKATQKVRGFVDLIVQRLREDPALH